MHAAARRLITLLATLLVCLPLLGAAPASHGDPCPGLTAVQLPDGSVTCTHGDDAHLGDHVAADGTTVEPLRTAPPQCYSDGVDGFRVGVLYVHATGTPNRVGKESRRRHPAGRGRGRGDGRGLGRGAGGPTPRAVGDRGRRHGLPRAGPKRGHPGRGPRRPAVDGDGPVGPRVRPRGPALRAVRRRRQLLRHRHHAADKQPGPDNAANRRAGYARVDRACWNRGDTGGYATMAHELFHTIGAVLPDAPHATRGGHCTDEWDPLCYDDGSGGHMWVRVSLRWGHPGRLQSPARLRCRRLLRPCPRRRVRSWPPELEHRQQPLPRDDGGVRLGRGGPAR